MDRVSHFDPNDEAARRLRDTPGQPRARMTRQQFVDMLERRDSPTAVRVFWPDGDEKLRRAGPESDHD